MKKKIIAISLTVGFLVAVGLLLWRGTVLDAHFKGANRPERTFSGRRPPLPNFHEPVDYVCWVNEYIAEGKSPENAATYAGFWRHRDDEEYIPEPSQVVRDKLYRIIRGPNWKAGDYPEVEAYIRDTARFLALFCREAGKSEHWIQFAPAPDLPRLSHYYPHILSGRHAVCMLLAQGWRDGERQFDRMREAWQVGLRHSDHLALSKMQGLHIGASYTRLILYQSIRDALHHGVVRPEDCAAVVDILSGATMPDEGLTETLFHEWGGALGLLQELYAGENFNWDLADTVSGLRHPEPVPAKDPMRASRIRPDRLVPEIDEYYATVLRIADAPLSYSSLRHIQRIEAAHTRLVPLDHPLRPMIRQRTDHAYIRALRVLASLRATMTLLLMHQYRAREGRWPDSLEQIDVPERLDCLKDPFSDKQLVYRRSEESFVLYSVSDDGIDNNGTHREWGGTYKTDVGADFVFWPVQFPFESEDH